MTDNKKIKQYFDIDAILSQTYFCIFSFSLANSLYIFVYVSQLKVCTWHDCKEIVLFALESKSNSRCKLNTH